MDSSDTSDTPPDSSTNPSDGSIPPEPPTESSTTSGGPPEPPTDSSGMHGDSGNPEPSGTSGVPEPSDGSESESSVTASSSSSSSGCNVGAVPLEIVENPLIPPGRICQNAQDTYRRAKWQIYVDEGATASVTMIYGPASLVGATTGLSNGDIFYVQENGNKPGPYLMRITRDDGLCYSLAGEHVFKLFIEDEKFPFSFDGHQTNNQNGYLPKGTPDKYYQAWYFHATLWGFSLDQRARVSPTDDPRQVKSEHTVSRPYYLETQPEGMYGGCVEFGFSAAVGAGGTLVAVGGPAFRWSGTSIATFNASIQVTGFRQFDGPGMQSIPTITADATNKVLVWAIVSVPVNAKIEWHSSRCVAAIKENFTVQYIPRVDLNMEGGLLNPVLPWKPSGYGDIKSGGFALTPNRYILVKCPQ